jgi:MFS transporter, ACS family, glucarate transporter
MITYLDRAVFSNAHHQLTEALGLTKIADLDWAMTAFLIAYSLFEVPTGWLGDVFGPRKTLIRIVLWWSFFTVLIGLTGLSIAGITLINLTVLIVVQFFFGMGEAGAYPNITRALHNWFPRKERGITQGAVWFCSRGMGGLTPLVWLILVEKMHLSWRLAFLLFGLLGVSWCIAFFFWFRSRPEEHPAVNEAELKLIRSDTGHDTESAHAGIPWRQLFASRTLWVLCIIYFCMSYCWYFNLTYLPAYLEQQHGVKRDEWYGALYKGSPLLAGAVGCLLGGFLTDRFIRRTGNRVWGRRIFGLVGHGLCVPCYLYCVTAPTAFSFALAIAVAGFCNDLAMGSAWAACQDIGKRYAAVVAGCMNTIGNLGGAVGAWLTGTILHTTLNAYTVAHELDMAALEQDPTQKDLLQATLKNGMLPGYNYNFLICAAIYLVVVFLWLGVNATRPIVPEDGDKKS